MADNTEADAGSGGAKFLTLGVSFSGDAVQLPASALFGAAGSEGSWTVAPIPGDATNGLLVNLGANNDVAATLQAGTAEIGKLAAGVAEIGNVKNSGTFPVQAAQSGTWNINNVSGTISLPTGAATAAKQLADGHNVTVDNANGAAAVNIQDGGNSITVDNGGTFVVQENGAALTALQLIDDPVFADDAPFTLTSSKTMVAGAMRDDNTSVLSAAEGDIVPLRVDQSGHLHVHSHLFDPGTIDGLGHILMNEAVNQTEIQFFRDTPANLLTVTTAGGGATSQVGGAGKFETSTATTANAKGVTALSTSYRSASEIFTFFSALFTTPTDGNGFQRIGLYDDNNGVFLGFEGTTFGVSIRNAASDTQTAKASFSEDALTGATGSLFTRAGVPEAIDLTKFNLFRIRFGWFGSAPIFYEVLSPDDHWVTFHVIRQPNNAVVASMQNPDLPMTLHVSKTSADATNLIMLTNCWAAGVTTGSIPLNATLTDANLAKVVRTVIAGKTPGGSYVNIETTTGGNLKMSVEEISDGLDIGAGNAGSETQRMSIATDDVNLSAIKTAVEAAIVATTDSISAALQTNQIMNGTTSLTPKFVAIDAASSGDNTILAAVSAKKIRVLQVILVAAGDVNVRFESGAAGTALTGQMNLTTNSGFEASFCPVGHFETGSNVLLNLELSAAVSVDGWLVYVEV